MSCTRTLVCSMSSVAGLSSEQIMCTMTIIVPGPEGPVTNCGDVISRLGGELASVGRRTRLKCRNYLDATN